MNVRIFDTKPQEILLKLVNSGEGIVDLEIVDERGERKFGGILLCISEHGIRLVADVNKKCGIALDDNGYVLVSKDDEAAGMKYCFPEKQIKEMKNDRKTNN